MTYRFTGDSPLTYPAYRDLETDRTLTAVPQSIYDMEAAGGQDLPVPPGDGRWEAVTADPPPPPAPAPPVVTTASTEDEGTQSDAIV